MKILFVGGSGNISSSCVQRAIDGGHEVSILSRGNREAPHPAVEMLRGDIHDPDAVAPLLEGRSWDVVANFIAFRPDEIDRVLAAHDALVAGIT